MVRAIGKVKFFKNELKIDGAKIMNVSFNDFIYHKIAVSSDWIYLTKGSSSYEEKNLNNNGSA